MMRQALNVVYLQVKAGSIFDNILVADSVDDAKDHAANTFEKLKESEKVWRSFNQMKDPL